MPFQIKVCFSFRFQSNYCISIELLFDFIGSRTIRTEEAVLIALTALEDKLNPAQRPKKSDWSQLLAQSEDTGVKRSTQNNQKHENE